MASGDIHEQGTPLVFGPQRYLTVASNTNADTSFIDYDTDFAAGIDELTLRDEDHAAGRHYWIRVTSNSTGSLSIKRPSSGSSKTINGQFVGQTFNGATQFSLLESDGVVRIRPEGVNWTIY